MLSIKNPGVRPIGVGEVHVLRRLFGKAMEMTNGIDVEEVPHRTTHNTCTVISITVRGFFIDPYCRGYSSLWVGNSCDPSFSKEGVTQGDTLSMCFYAVAIDSDHRSVHRLGLLMTLRVLGS